MSVWVGGCGMHVRAPTCQVNDVMLSQVLSSVQFGFLGLKPNFGAPVKSFVTLGVLAGTLGTASAQGKLVDYMLSTSLLEETCR